jgi:hypothetical protein
MNDDFYGFSCRKGGLRQSAFWRPRGGARLLSRYTKRYRTMTLATGEFIRRFMLHVLPKGLSPHSALWPARERRPQGSMSPAPVRCSRCRR